MRANEPFKLESGKYEVDVSALAPEDLAPLHQAMANVIGMEDLIAMSDAFGGTSIYIPQRRELVKFFLFRQIAAEFNGFNRKELAIKYGLSESTIYNVIKDQIVKGQARKELNINIPGQMNIFDFDI